MASGSVTYYRFAKNLGILEMSSSIRPRREKKIRNNATMATGDLLRIFC